ncbi:NADPH-dependent F420 reductase [Streptomyces olindensis]|uniref:NADPH-dependent F420 reductase n=1 Tax=Streptomyces olindensis TaxID=358823 RepID=UPI0033D7A24F
MDTAELVVLAVPFAAAKELTAALGARLSGKVLVDISNPVDASLDALVVSPGTSAAEEIAAVAAPGTKVVKAFNTTFATTLVAGRVAGTPLDVFIAGDDEVARKQVADLVTSGGLHAVDVGALKHARELEGFQLLHMALQISEGGYGWASTVKLVAP